MATSEPSELRLDTSPKKGLMFLAISCAFVAGGLFMRHEEPLMGWFTVCFFGLGIPGSLILMLPQFSYLKLDPAGFEVCTLGRGRKIAWSDIADLQLVSIEGTKMVGFNYAPTYSRLRAGRAVSSALSGVEGRFQIATKSPQNGFSKSCGPGMRAMPIQPASARELV